MCASEGKGGRTEDGSWRGRAEKVKAPPTVRPEGGPFFAVLVGWLQVRLSIFEELGRTRRRLSFQVGVEARITHSYEWNSPHNCEHTSSY